MAVHSFYAFWSRMKYITRWSLMRNTRPETLGEHAGDVAAIAYCLALIRQKRLGGSPDVTQAVLFGLFHDCSEILTGDLPTPVKYHDKAIRGSYREVERQAARRLAATLPEDLREDFLPYLTGDGVEAQTAKLVKAADKIAALCKCAEEERCGNREFEGARTALEKALKEMHLPEAEIFMEEFFPAFALTLDELEPDLSGKKEDESRDR
ncbi:MAG: 5'-deoxynucleotidase [Oscillospiraceae bacterium]|nr:5'-deoxynucleotidase [Oscillospiraceae bacterium]